MRNRILSCAFTICLLLCMIVPAALAADKSVISSRTIDGVEYFYLGELGEVSAIFVTENDDAVCLSEDGLTVCLTANSKYILRDKYIIAGMKHEPITLDGKWYASIDFYNDFLCKGDMHNPSLFNGTLFYASEVLFAINGDGSDVPDRRILEAVSLPTSMGINAPHIDMGRIFVENKLSNYPVALSNELRRLGIAQPENLAYSEYVVINGAQTLSSAGMSSVVETTAELEGVDPNKMTVAEYTKWQQEHAAQQFEKGLSDTTRQFAANKNITLSDLSHLNRYFYGSFAEKGDEELIAVLEQYYSTDINYLQSMCQPFSDVTENNWFFDDVMYAYFNGLMNGYSDNLFAPNDTSTRGQIVTILYRLENEPVVSNDCPFTDVASGSYYENAITWAAANSIVLGYGENFGPDDVITREQMATILWRYAKYKDYDVSVGENTNILSYNDAFDVADYAIPAMQWTCGSGLMQGASKALTPKDNATRCQVAAILHRFCLMLEEE